MMGSMTSATGAAEFARVARRLADSARALGLVVPGFRSPPRLPGADRTIRRGGAGSSLVAVRSHDRPWAAVVADLIEGVVVANRLDQRTALRARAALWEAVAEASGEAA
jgi:hypothetical protein